MNSLSDLQQMVNGNIKRHRNSQCVGAKTLHNNLVKCSSNVSNARKLSPLRNNVLSVSDFEGGEQQSTNTRPSSVQFNDRISTSDSVLSFSIEGDSVSNGSLFTLSSSNSRATSARQRRKLKLAREKSQKQVILDHEQRINLLLGEYFTVVNRQQTSNDRLHLPGENYLDFGFHETSARQALVDKLIKDIQDAVRVSSSSSSASNSPSRQQQQALSPQQKQKLQRNRVSLDAWKGAANSPRELTDNVELFVELRYLELKEKERSSLNVPTKNKAAVAADLLLKLCGLLGGHSVVLRELVYELLNCVFEDYYAAPRSFSLEQSAEDFSAMRLFVEGYADQCEQIEDLQQEIEWMKQGVKMKAIVKKFQCVRLVFDPSARFLRDTCFNLWKSTYTRSVSYKHFQIRKQLKHRVHLWKEYVRDKYVRIRNELRANRSVSTDSADTDGVSPTGSDDSQQTEDAQGGKGVDVSALLGDVFADVVSDSKQSEHKTDEGTRESVTVGKMKLSVDIGLAEGLDDPMSSLPQQPKKEEEESPSRTQQRHHMTETMRAISAAVSRHDAAPNGNSGNSYRILVPPDSPHEGGDEEGNNTFGSPMAYSARMPVRANHPNGKSFSRRKSSAMGGGGGDEYLTRRLSILQKERSSQLDQVNSELMATLSTYNARQSMLRSTRSSFADGGESLSPGSELWAVTAATSEVPSPPNASSSNTAVTSPRMQKSRQTSIATFGGGRDGKFLRESVVARGETHGAGRASVYLNTLAKKELSTGETQTPASWMGNVALLDMDRSSVENNSATGNNEDDEDTSPVLSEDSPGPEPMGERSPSKLSILLLRREDSHSMMSVPGGGGGGEKKYLMDVRAAEELIAFVYGSLLPDASGESSKLHLSDFSSLVSYSKELLLQRYAIKRLASKLSKGLVKCCLTHAPSNRRLGLFAQLCGITIESVAEGADAHRTVSPAALVRFDRRRFAMFLNILGLLFHNDAKELRLAMNGDTQDVWRETALSALPAMFPAIHRTDYELFAFIRFEINSLSVTSVEHNAEYTLPLMKVNVDELLLLLLDYMDLESNTASHSIMPFERIGSSGNGPLDVKQVHLF